MATPFVSASFTPSPNIGSWCFLLLEHLDEFATLACYLVADGKLVEETFSRTMAKLDTIPFGPSFPSVAYSQARDVLITQAIAVLSDVRKEVDENWFFHPNSIRMLPDLPRLAFMLRMIVRSSEAEVANYLKVPPSEVQALVGFAIERLSIASPVALVKGCSEA
jgi:hypothetical protein